MVGRKVDSSDFLDHAARAGLVVYGVIHLVVAATAFQLILGSSSGTNASQSGAFAEMGRSPYGDVLLYVITAGLVALVVWQVGEALVGHRDHDGAKRVWKRLASVGKAVVYGSLAYTAGSMALSANKSGGSGKSTDNMTAQLMSAPGGQLLVGAVGLGIVAVGAWLVYRGWSERFVKDLDAEARNNGRRKPITMLGKAGYTAKGVALGTVGTLFVIAAVQHQPKESGGLDVALHELLRQPYGAVLVGAVAAGLACFGLFCLAWARHLDR